MGVESSQSESAHLGLLAMIACAAAVALHLSPVLQPRLIDDDVSILLESWSWNAARANLWVPANEHAMPLGRMSNWLLIQVAGRPSALPQLVAFQAPLAVLAGMGLVYLFVRRERADPVYGLVAMVLFGVSTQYREAVYWFAASFAVLTLDTILLALLAAQRWRQTGRWPFLLLCVLGCALAPGWFASGVLAGPLCCLYLIFPERFIVSRTDESGRRRWCRLAAALAPLLGTLFFLAISLPHNAERILHAEHYGPKTAVEAFDLGTGLGYTGRSLVDNLTLGSVGISGVVCPVVLVPIVLALLATATLWWWRRAPERRLLLLGLGFIFPSYWLMYSARADWSYEEQMYAWSRYNLFPHLGLVLFICGGLPRRMPATPVPVGALGLLIGTLFLSQLPRGLALAPPDPQQMADLRSIEEMDARCRAYHIGAATARSVLPRELISGNTRINRWEFLRGSDEPRPITADEARRCLRPEEDRTD
jgi:hypothetical protein